MEILKARFNERFKQDLFRNDFFKNENLTRDDVGRVLSQYWHPLHYFPEFLAKLVAVVPETALKTEISSILFQELGEGNPERAHEHLYLTTMSAAGFNAGKLLSAPPTAATQRLMEDYKNSTDHFAAGLGFLYGTEVIDLFMVNGIASHVRSVSKIGTMPWVDIHVRQEPEHVQKANSAIEPIFSPSDQNLIIEYAELSWTRWSDFFSELDKSKYKNFIHEVAI